MLPAIFRIRTAVTFATTGAAIMAATPAIAMDSFFVGARGQAMAGSLTASVDDVDAQYYNPAAFGFFDMRAEEGNQLSADNNNLGRKDFGLSLDAGVGYRAHGRMGEHLDTLSGADLDRLTDGIQSQSEAEELLKVTSSLAGIDKPDNALLVDANGGTGLRIGNFGIGFRAMAQASARVVNLDSQNLGFDVNANQLVNEINTNTSGGDQNPDVLSPDQQDRLVTTLKNNGVDQTDAQSAIRKLDDAAADAGVSPGDAEETTNLLNTALDNTDTGTTTNENTTEVMLRGFGLAEIPISYGYAFNQHWSLGGNLKIMRGRVYGNQVLVFDDDNDDVVAKTDERYEETTTLGADIGVMGRYELFNVGLMARNINSPEFDGFTYTDQNNKDYQVPSVTVDPQVRAGVAFIPFNTLTLELDYDITANETAFSGYDTQFLSAGVEWDAFRFLALRAGTYKNMAEDDIGAVYTAGLGLNLWAVRLDIAGAMSADDTTVDGSDVPREARATAEISVDF